MTEERALQLIRGVAGEIATALSAGRPLENIRAEIISKHGPTWERDHGHATAREAQLLLETRMGPAAFLTPYGAEKAGLIPPGSSRRYSGSKKAGPHWFWLILQWIANWR